MGALASTACNSSTAQTTTLKQQKAFNCPDAPPLEIAHEPNPLTEDNKAQHHAPPKPKGKTVRVSNATALLKAVNTLSDHTTIIVAPGQYRLNGTLVIRKNHITIRGEKPDCVSTELIGKGMENADHDGVPHGIWSNAKHLTIAHLTIRDVYQHAIKLNPTAHAPTLHHLRLLDSGKQFIKASPKHYGKGVNDGKLTDSILAYTQHPPRTNHGGGSGYTNGIDVHAGKNWLVDGNIFMNFHTPDDSDHLWNPAVLFWNGAEGTITQNNIFFNVDRAIAYGLTNRRRTTTTDAPSKPNSKASSQNNSQPTAPKTNNTSGDYDHIGGIIRNNMITLELNLFSHKRRSESDASIIVWDSPYTKVLHNTVLNRANHHFAIETRFDTHNAEIKNNWSDARINQRRKRQRNNEKAESGPSNNQINNNHFSARTQYFVAPQTGDLHLTSDAASYAAPQVPYHPDAPSDIDGDKRPQTKGKHQKQHKKNNAGADQAQ